MSDDSIGISSQNHEWAIGTYYDDNDEPMQLGHYRDSDAYYKMIYDSQTGETSWVPYSGTMNYYPSGGLGVAIADMANAVSSTSSRIES